MKSEETYDVAIVGGGPVGLLLGIMLSRMGINNVILEKQNGIDSHSRSIGIHPPSLHVLERVGLQDEIINAGVKIRQGLALIDAGNPLGSIRFELLPEPYQFVLAVPQYRTEQILENAIAAETHTTLLKGREVHHIDEHDDFITVSAKDQNNDISFTTRFLVGCDGKDSMTRRNAGIFFQGDIYPNSYVMGDFKDNISFDDDALIFVTNNGLVESFPLPGNKRRWVVETSEDYTDKNARETTQIIKARTGLQPDPDSNSMLSNFGTERYLATTFHRGRFILAGDAAHVLSPIGGQGMNLGWLDCDHLARALEAIIRSGAPVNSTLDQYSRHRRKKAKQAIKRSEFNMLLGHRNRFPGIRNLVVRQLLKAPVNRYMARRFTMAGLQ